MRIVFAIGHVGYFRHYDAVVRQLCSKGAGVQALFGPQAKATDRALPAGRAELLNFERGWLSARGDNWRRPLAWSRELLNYAIYLKPEHPSPGMGARWKQYLPRPIRFLDRHRFTRNWQNWLVKDGMLKTLRRFEEIAPPDKTITSWLMKNRPDVLVASPLIMGFPIELEYIKAAKALKIPTIAAVASWDNLTTKGIFHVVPDLTLVWNEALADEAVTLHGIPREKIFVTGAPTFDYWFEMEPSLDRISFCRSAGLDPGRPFVVYLGSSTTIAGDEAPFVAAFLRSLRANKDTRDVQLLIRPHPINASIWKGFSARDVVVWPERGDVPDVREARQDYYHTLFYSQAVVGVNTSAMLEAAIVDKPCVTILSETYRSTQMGIGHFRHLLDGDFLEVADDFEQAVAILGHIGRGRDLKGDRRRRFVKRFIRPGGIDKPAAEIMADIIAGVALGKEDARRLSYT